MRLPLLLVGLVAGCGQTGPQNPDLAALGSHDPRPCSPAVRSVPDEGATHVPFGTAVSYQSNPPASGPHWPSPHPWGAYPDAIPREWWVHNLEHGGIVFLFNCPDASADAGVSDGGGAWPCPAVTDALRQVAGELPLDKWNEVRTLVTADPLMPRPIAAVAWDWIYEADAIDLTALRCFRDARYGQGPEDAP